MNYELSITTNHLNNRETDSHITRSGLGAE